MERKLNRKEKRMFASNKFKAKQKRKQMENAKEVKPIRQPEVVFKEYGNACAAYGDAKLRESMLGVEVNQLWNKMIELRDEHVRSIAAQPKQAVQPEVKSEEPQSVPS